MLDLNKIYLGNCLEYMRNDIEDGSVGLVLTDPPYLIDYQSNHRKEKFDKIANDTNPEFIMCYIQECYRILKNNSSCYMFCDYKTIEFFKPAFEALFNLKNILVWVKNNWTGGDLDGAFGHQYELILFGTKGKNPLRGKRFPDVLTRYKRVVSSNKKTQRHPTEKPVDLLEFLIKQVSDEGDIVFDGCIGSGATAIAAINSNRKFIGIELDEQYYYPAVERIDNHVKQLRLF